MPAAANLLIEMVTARPGEITVLALGPLTNLALAARLAPGIVPLVREVVAKNTRPKPMRLASV